jgi:phenylacetate-CoA ligase
MRQWQATQLRRVLVHAGEHVPYYRDIFRHRGFDPSRLESVEELQRLPVLSREVVKHRGRELTSRAPGAARPAEGHTSGTTGSPITLFYDDDMIAMNYAVMDRQYRWADCRLERNGDRIAVVRGNVIVPLTQKKPPFWRYNRDLNQILLSSFSRESGGLPGCTARVPPDGHGWVSVVALCARPNAAE